jgi:hypothetical protein
VRGGGAHGLRDEDGGGGDGELHLPQAHIDGLTGHESNNLDASDPNSLEISNVVAMALVARTLTRWEESRGYTHGLLSEGVRWRLERGCQLPRDALLIRWRWLRAKRLGIMAGSREATRERGGSRVGA